MTVYEDPFSLVTVYEDPNSWITDYEASTARQLFQIQQLPGVQRCLLLDQVVGEGEQGGVEELLM